MKHWMTILVACALNLSASFWVCAADGAASRTNVALAANGGVAVASSAGAYPVANVNDGVLVPANNEYWRDVTSNRWPDSVMITFNGQKTISEIGVVTAQTSLASTTVPIAGVTTFAANGITSYSVQYCSDTTSRYTTTCPVSGAGSKWVNVKSVTGNKLVWRTFTFTPATTRRIRVVVKSALQANSRIVEIEAYEDGASPTVSFAAAGSSGAESVTPVRLSVSLSAASGRAVTVPYAVSGTSSGGGVDYTLAGGALSFNPGTTSQTISFPVVDDAVFEGSETVVVTLGMPTNATLGAYPAHTYTITDNDPSPTVSFAAAGSSGAESATPVRLSVSLSAASGRTVTVPYAVSGTASGGGVDYTLAGGALSFNPGTTSQTISFPVVDDAVFEGSETVVVTLGTPTDATLGAYPAHTYTIIDNDPANATPSTAGVTPAAAVSLTATTKPFTARYSDRDGYEDLAVAQLRIETITGSGTNALWVRYDRQSNRVSLFNDAGTGTVAAGCAPGEAVVLENSQGTVDCASISVSGSGTILTVQWPLTPKVPLAGGVPRNIVMQATDDGNLTSGWVQAGNWTVRDTLPAFSRSFPVTISGIQVFVDQLAGGLSGAQNRFVAEHMAGAQKMTKQLTDPIRAYNPNFLVLQYRLTYGISSVFNITDLNTWDLDALDPSYPGIDPRKTQEEYYYHHDGSRVLHADSYALADIGSSDWRDYQINELLRRMPTNDFDGVFLDTAHIRNDGFSPYSWYESFCGPDITLLDDCWTRDAVPYLTDLRDRLHFSGTSARYAIGNYGALITGWDSYGYLKPLDGGMIENFMLDGGVPLTQGDWHIAADRLLKLIGNDRIMIAQPYIGSTRDVATRKFVLGNFLLFKGRHSFLSNYTGEFGSVGPPVWFPEYDVPIGAPRATVAQTPAGYCQGNFGGSSCSGVYERDFTCGTVVVNPHDSARTYTLAKLGAGFSYGEFDFSGGGYVTSSGQKATQAIQYLPHSGFTGQLPARSARVLIHLDVGGAPTCTDILPPDPDPVLESIILPAVADTWVGVRDDERTRNYGAAPELRTYSNGLDGGNTRFTLIRFDLSTLPAGATIMDARLDFTGELILYPDNALMRVQRVTSSWVEGSNVGDWWETPNGATWVSRGPGLPNWATVGGDVAEEVCQLTAALGHNSTCNLTALARQWAAGTVANNGIRLSNVNAYSDDMFITSRQGATTTDHPCLVVKYTLGDPGALDSDDDGIPDISDNCPFDANPDQTDSDQDSIGDVCDPTPNGPPAGDDDGIPDDADNCPYVYNPDQTDSDQDGIGDVCDPTPYGSGHNDGDGIADGADNCPGVYNPSQADTDQDGIGDACDPTPNGPGSHADLRSIKLAIIAGRTAGYGNNAGLAQPTNLAAFHRSGQTFITWTENSAITGESYLVYRHTQPISAANLAQATLIAMVAEGSSLYRTEVSRGRGQTRYIINDLDSELEETTGLHVYTVDTAGSFYYAVITVARGSANRTSFTTGNAMAQPVAETVADPLPVMVGTGSDGYHNTSRIYTQFMDPMKWNETMHGYAYNYSVTVPQGYDPGAANLLPLTVHIEGKGSRYAVTEAYTSGIYISIDAPYIYGSGEQDWYWGFSCHHDFQNATNFDVAPGPVCNFSEVRTLRAVRDTLLDPYYRNHADPTRIYAYGHSMGGSGVISWGMHYPWIFTLVYASQGMTNYAADPVWRNENIGRFGPLALNNPVLNLGVRWLDGSETHETIRDLDGMGIWDYLDHKTIACSPKYQGMDTAYILAAHGTADNVIQPSSQGYPFYECLNIGRRGFTAEINAGGHTWQNYTPAADIDFRVFTFPWNDWEDAMPNTPGLDRNFPLQSYIAFSNATGSTLSVTTGLAHYNRYLQWDVKTIVDQVNRYQVDLYARETDQTADVTPRRFVNFVVKPGGSYLFTNQRSGATGKVTANSGGILTIPAVAISTMGSRLVIVPE